MVRVAKKSKKEEESKHVLNRFNHIIKGSEKLTKLADEKDKLKLERLKSFSSSITEKKKEIFILKKLNTADERPNLTEEPQKKKLGKLKSCLTSCTKRKNKDNSRLERFNFGGTRSRNEYEKQMKSFRDHIAKNCKWVVLLFFIYIIILGAIISVPIYVNHLRARTQNKTEQERFVT